MGLLLVFCKEGSLGFLAYSIVNLEGVTKVSTGGHVVTERSAVFGYTVVSSVKYSRFCSYCGHLVIVVTVYMKRGKTWYLRSLT